MYKTTFFAKVLAVQKKNSIFASGFRALAQMHIVVQQNPA